MKITNQGKNCLSLFFIRALEDAVANNKTEMDILPWFQIRKGKIEIVKISGTHIDFPAYRKCLWCVVDHKYSFGISAEGEIIDCEIICDDENGHRNTKHIERTPEIDKIIDAAVHPFMDDERAYINAENAFWAHSALGSLDFLNTAEALDVLNDLRKNCCAVYLPA